MAKVETKESKAEAKKAAREESARIAAIAAANKAAAKAEAQSELRHVPPGDLVMQDQVRTESDERADSELVESIKLYGVMLPITAREVGGKLIVNDGHRRTAAAIVAERATVPVYVTTITEEEVTARQLVANLQRLDMSLMDVADGVWKLYNGPADGVSKVVAGMLGKTKSWVSKMLLLSAPGKAHTVARGLMAADKLHDIEMAYTLCQIEEIDKDEAQAAGLGIEEHTRATLKRLLDDLSGGASATDEKGEGDGSNEGEPAAPLLSLDVLTFLQRVVTEATVSAADMAVKKRALTVLQKLLADQPTD